MDWDFIESVSNFRNIGNQCTDFIDALFQQMYGYSCYSATNADGVARNLFTSRPDEFGPGSVNSLRPGTVWSIVDGGPGHVGGIISVNDGLVTFADGNVNGYANRIRVETVSISQFESELLKWHPGGYIEYAVPYNPPY